MTGCVGKTAVDSPRVTAVFTSRDQGNTTALYGKTIGNSSG